MPSLSEKGDLSSISLLPGFLMDTLLNHFDIVSETPHSYDTAAVDCELQRVILVRCCALKRIGKYASESKDLYFNRRKILAQARCAFIFVLTGKKPNSAAISDDILDVFFKPIIHCRLKIIVVYSPTIASAEVEAILLSDHKRGHVTVTVSLPLLR